MISVARKSGPVVTTVKAFIEAYKHVTEATKVADSVP
jgi:hypothetical protein